jgi:hypothetical protein
VNCYGTNILVIFLEVELRYAYLLYHFDWTCTMVNTWDPRSLHDGRAMFSYPDTIVANIETAKMNG